MKSRHARQIQRCVTEWFKEHTATFHPNEAAISGGCEWSSPKLLIWQKPDRGTYRCRYVIDQRTLFVHGDIGEAVYCWGGDPLTWDFLQSTDLEYFAGKCCASEVGRDFRMWDGRQAAESIQAFLQEYRPDLDKAQCVDIVTATRATANQDDYMENVILCDRNLFPDPSQFCDWGYTIHVRCIGHWVGIQMAMGKTEEMLKRYEI